MIFKNQTGIICLSLTIIWNGMWFCIRRVSVTNMNIPNPGYVWIVFAQRNTQQTVDWFSRENLNRKPSIFPWNMGLSGEHFPQKKVAIPMKPLRIQEHPGTGARWSIAKDCPGGKRWQRCVFFLWNSMFFPMFSPRTLIYEWRLFHI